MARTYSYCAALVFSVLVVGGQSLFAVANTSGDVPSPMDYGQKLAMARSDFFADLEGNHSADAAARKDFASLRSERPGDPLILAYLGSLDLLEAGRTWAFWNKHVLSQQGLSELDNAVKLAPENLEVRFIRGATTWHLPFIFHRKQQAESDFTYVGPRAESAARHGTLPPQLAAAALDYYGQVLSGHNDSHGAKRSYEAAVRVDSASPGGKDASKHLRGD